MPDTDRHDAEAQKYPNVVRFVRETPWAILESKLQDITEIVAMRAAGRPFTEEEIEARIGAGPARKQAYMTDGQVAVIPIYGVITPRADLMSQMSGGTSIQGLQNAVRAAVADPKVTGILFEIDSPGGAVEMLTEMSAEIRAARKQKPVLAVANTMAGSAAYWLGSQASSFSVTPSGSVGSVGVIAMHDDISALQEKMGIKTTVITAGKYKGEFSSVAPLSDEARARAQESVDKAYAMFVQDVARGRGAPVETVRADYGQGRMMLAKDALAAGMVDQIETYDQALARLESGKVTPSRGLAAMNRAEALVLEDGAWALDDEPPPDEPETDTDVEAAESGLFYAHSWAEEAETLLAGADALLQRTTSLAEVKRGALTGAKRDRLTACTEALRETTTALTGLLAATSPSKQADALMRERMRFERHRANL